MSDLVQSVADDIQLALDKDQLDLPTLPEVALRVRDVASSELVSASALAEVVGEDPGLSTQLVRVANSPMFRATRSIDDLAQAISRLGVDYAANIVTGLAMQNMFQATSEMVDIRLRQVWKASTEVAAWSSILTKRFTKLRADQATLAGLTHCIGVLPILGWVEENDHVIHDSLTLDRVIETLHPTIGTMILKHWNFASELVEVPGNYQQTDHDSANADYVDIVCVAHVLCHTDEDHPVHQKNWAESPSFGRVGFDLEMDDFEREEILAQVTEVKGVLV